MLFERDAASAEKHLSLPAWAKTVLAVLLCGALSWFGAVHLAFPRTAWIPSFVSTPPLAFFALLPLYVLSCLAWPRDAGKWASRVFSAIVLLTLYLSVSFQSYWYGDSFLYDLGPSSAGTTVFSSSLGGHALYLFANHIDFNRALLSPFIGFCSALLFFKLADVFFSAETKKEDRYLAPFAGILYAVSGLHWVFIRNYQEMTQPAVPCVLLFLLLSILYLRTKASWDSLLLIGAALALGMAGIIHGQNTFLLPSLGFLVFFRHWKSRNVLLMGMDLILMLLTLGALAIAVFSVVRLLGFQLDPHDLYGGGDGITFLPLHLEAPTNYIRFSLFALPHSREVANILALLCPLLFGLPIAVWKRWKGGQPWTVVETYLAVVSLGFLCFLFPYCFDLGYPTDTDLMLSMGTPLLLLTTLTLARLRPRIIFLCALIGIPTVWWVIGSAVGHAVVA